MSTPDRLPKQPTSRTAALNQAAAAVLSLDDPGDFARANRGLIATHPTGVIDGPFGPAWDVSRHDFNRGDVPAPPSVNPSLWRQGRLNSIHGVFEVGEGIWQVRGYDLSNMTFLAGDGGWVIVDVLTSDATAAASLELMNQTVGARPVSAVIYTHSHVDHYGGIEGVTSQEAVDRGDVRIIAPEGFLREAVSENMIAGPIMRRRAAYMFGPLLPPGPLGHVDSGLGKVTPLAGSGLIAPTEEVSETGAELTVDGIRVVFQNTPGSEAPAEMNFLFPEKRTLCMAENCTHTMHNILTPRGAQVRDTLGWSKYINEAIELFIDRTDTLFSTHHWPRWGNADARAFLEKQRDVYRWLHDQTMRLANHGFTMTEIAEQLRLPECFSAQGHTREYYGTVSHNSKAIYQRYLGWFDGNPANLNPHPPVESGARYVEAIGGADAVVAKAKVAFDDGDYRWACQLLNHLVFAQPHHEAGRLLQADAFEQLGYQAESGPWRNFYLTGAQELRDGPFGFGVGGRAMSPALTIEMLFDILGVHLDAAKVEGVTAIINWTFTDLGEHHVLGLDNCAVHHTPGRHRDDADVTLTLTTEVLRELMNAALTPEDAVAGGRLGVLGDRATLDLVLGALDLFDGRFAIVEP